MLPALSNAGLSAPSDSTVVPGRTPSSVSKSSGSPLRCGISTAIDLVVEAPVLDRRGGALVALGREVVLKLTRDVARCRVLLGAGAHEARVERAPQTVADDRVLQRRVAVAEARPDPGKDVRRVRHRLHAARDDDVGLARLDHQVGEVDRVETREAHLVHGGRRDGHRDARVHRCLPRGDLALSCADHLAHEDVVDLVGGEARRARARP